MQLSIDRRELLPSNEDVEFYQEHGWYISKKIFSDEQIDEALEATERHYAGQRDRDLPVQLQRYLDWTPDQGADRLRLNDFIVLQNAVIGQLGLDPIIGAIAARLAGTDQIRLLNSSLVYKPPEVQGDHVKVGWHVDRAYQKSATSDNMLTAWIPLHDVDESMGTLTHIDGSHKWPATEVVEDLRKGKTFISDDVSGLEERIEASGLPIHKVPMNLKKGQVSFHHCLTLHGSGLNRSQTPRRAVAVHMQDRDNEYRRYIDEDGEPFAYKIDGLVRKTEDGRPDYSDPDICPVIWEA